MCDVSVLVVAEEASVYQALTRKLALAMGFVMAVSVVGGVPPATAAAQAKLSLAREPSVPVRSPSVPPTEPSLDKLAARGTPKVSWPAPGQAEVALGGGTGRARAGDLPVSVGAPSTTAPSSAATGGAGAAQAAPGRVRVEMLPRRADGLMMRVRRADGVATKSRASVSVDYSSFRHAYGGDWAIRLRLVELPECALSTPERTECAGTPVPTRNNGSGQLSGDVTVPAEGTAGGLYGVLADASSGAGDFKATGLSPSSTWTVGTSSGDFSWQYPMEVPPGLGGPQPNLALAYSSGSVDGRTSGTNNQTSWVGEGFEFNPGGYIEQRFANCANDMTGGNNSGRKTGDLCWRKSAGGVYDNAIFSLNGSGGELVRDDATGQWHSRVDDGSKVERLTGADNGDRGGDHWRITTRDGTQYYFGLNKLPVWVSGNPTTKSTWTVPVAGNHSGEPCYQSTFAASFCDQAWRWNLDYVVDRSGNTMSFFYETETNNYARNITATTVSTYIRGGWLRQIDYGQRDKEVYTKPAIGRIIFKEADRCIPGTTCTLSQPGNWPDVPWDQACSSTTNCGTKFNPAFFSQKRLASVTTSVWNGSAYKPVDSWELVPAFPDPGDGTDRRLWLSSIRHKGLVGGEVAMPEVIFYPVQRNNRVDGNDYIPPMNWFRVQKIRLDSGGEITVKYSTMECSAPNNLPVPDANTKRCHPARWTPDGLSERQDWFNKYVVTEVTEVDRTTGGPPTVTQIEYPGTPAWRFDDPDGLVAENRKTWSQWRGYDHVRLLRGAVGGVRTVTESHFFRGMHGDKKAAGGTKEVWLTDSTGKPVADADPLAGTAWKNVTYAAGNAVLEQELVDPWVSTATATRTRSWGTTQAFRLEEARVRQSEPTTTGGSQRLGADHTYDDNGVLLQSSELGNLDDPDDDTCTRYSYTRNEADWIIERPYRVETVSANCATTPTYPDDLLSDTRYYYDGNTTLGAAPTRGEVSRIDELSGWVSGAPTFVTTVQARQDVHGREIEVTDVKGAKTTITYTPATGGPATQVDVTNALGHRSRTTFEPAWGEKTSILDANDRKTELRYDPLGRLTKVWLPGRATSQTPNTEHSYDVRIDGANAVATKSLQPDGTYETEYQLYDGLMRPRQTQEPAPGGGRVVTDTFYDSRGLKVKENGPYHNDAPPGTDVVIPDETVLPAQTLTVYDEKQRPTDEIFKIDGVEKWRTTHTYGHNRHDIDPPAGETPTTRIHDHEGRLLELRQYHGDAPTGTYDATEYTYNQRGQLESVTDAANNVWQYKYDIRGFLIRTEEPDRGVTEYTYNNAGELTTERDAREVTLAHAYDILGRKTATHEGSLTGPKRTGRTYDNTLPDGSLARGLQTSTTRYDNGNAYTVSLTGIDEGGRPKGTRYTIPESEKGLAGTYEFTNTYRQNGDLASLKVPGAGGLPAEELTIGYDSLGMATTLTGASSYVTATSYTHFGELGEMTLSTGAKAVKLGYEYEYGTHRLRRATVARDTAPQALADVSYEYDPAGNVTKIKDSVQDAAETQCFRYDYLRRLTDAWTPGSGDCKADPVASGLAGPAPYWHSWTFDKTGNRTSETRTNTNGTKTSSVYTYPTPGLPRPHAVSKVTTTGPDGAQQVEEFGYDAAGNMASRKKGTTAQTLTWDPEGNLSSITKGGATTSFLYDAEGNRLIRRDPTGTTLYLGENELHLASNGTVTGTRYYTLNDRAVAVRTSADNKVHWLALDHHGTPEIAIDAASQAVQRRRHTPYGETRGAAPTGWPGQKGFVGGTADPSTGLVHLGAREYDPTLGKFISVDPVVDPSEPQQLNGYVYANNSPVTYSDSDGERWVRSTITVNKTVTQTVVRKETHWVQVWVSVTSWISKKLPGFLGAFARWVLTPVTTWYSVLKPVFRWVKEVITKVVKVTKTVLRWVKDHVKKSWNRAYGAGKWIAKKTVQAGKAANRARQKFVQFRRKPPKQTEKAIPRYLYRSGSKSPSNFKVRPNDLDGLSTFDNPQDAMANLVRQRPGKTNHGIRLDTSKILESGVFKIVHTPNHGGDGHWSIVPTEPEELREWMEKGNSYKYIPLLQQAVDGKVTVNPDGTITEPPKK
jgi:RHS repeat-associated protein